MLKIAFAIMLIAASVGPTLAGNEDPRCADYGETEVRDYIDSFWSQGQVRCLAKPGFQCPSYHRGIYAIYDPEKNLSKISCLSHSEHFTPRSIVYLSGKCRTIPIGEAGASRAGNKTRIPEGGYYSGCWRGFGDCTIRCD
jgi:hypothetical protein